MKPIYIELLIYLLLISFIIRTLRNLFYHTFLWQLKEYRIDRFWAHLKTDQGRRLILGPITSTKWILLLLIIGSILSEYKLLPETIADLSLVGFLAYLTFGFFWVIEAIIYIRELITKGWKIPIFTLKIIVILGVVLIFQFTQLGTGDLIGQLLNGPFLDKLLAPTVVFLVILLNIPSFLFRKIIVLLAKRKISRYRNLKVIGITGSFGKTSTKEFLAQMLSVKYNVLKTEGSTNTDIGVAQTVLSKLTDKYDVLIVEMGAYKKGEITAICKIVRPQIGIITGINQQHLQLFGGIEKTTRAKFELVQCLKKSGTAVFNIRNKYVREMVEWCHEQRSDLFVWKYFRLPEEKASYSRKKEDLDDALYAYDIKVQPDKIFFKMMNKNQDVWCSSKLIGAAHVDNILAAACVALKLGMTIEQIKKAISRIKAPAKTMKLVQGIKEAKFVDDTFNVNPDGVIVALEYMKLFAGKKILVLTPLIELGETSEETHRFLGREATKVCDLVLLTNLNYNKPFRQGAGQIVGGRNKIHVVNTIVGERIIKQNIGEDGVVVFEGKEAGKILKQLIP